VVTSWRLCSDTNTSCVVTKSPTGATGKIRRTHQRSIWPYRNAATVRICSLSILDDHPEILCSSHERSKLVDVFQGARIPWPDRPCQGTHPITRQSFKDPTVRTASVHAAGSPFVRAPLVKLRPPRCPIFLPWRRALTVPAQPMHHAHCPCPPPPPPAPHLPSPPPPSPHT